MSSPTTRLLRHLGLAILGLIACMLVIAALGGMYQTIATAKERARFSAPGKLVDIGGYQLHLRCAGEGRPAVILESGFGMSSNAWALVQPEVAKFTQVCSYDRTGYGWSDSAPAADPVSLLHHLLSNGLVSDSYVLVGPLVRMRTGSQVHIPFSARGRRNGSGCDFLSGSQSFDLASHPCKIVA